MKIITIEQNSDYPKSMKNPYYRDNDSMDCNVAYKRGQDSVFNHAFYPCSLTKSEKLSLLEAMGIPVDAFHGLDMCNNPELTLREFITRGTL
jgi:hypothetical protein